MDRPPVARLAGVSHRYGAVTALEAVDLALPAGCMVGLIGPDGVGKSSLLALVSGARQFQTGKIEVLGVTRSLHRIDAEASGATPPGPDKPPAPRKR